MTSNQISYRRLLEERRHNRAQEEETKRANLVTEKLRRKDQKIQSDYNAAHFMHNANVLSETARHNVASESKDLLHLTQSLAETQRHNIVSEQQNREKMELDAAIRSKELYLKQATLDENARHNTALEDLQFQTNSWNYELGQIRNDLTAKSQELDREISLMKLAEERRANVQAQLLQYSRDQESKRHNIATEQINTNQSNIRGIEVISSQLNQWYKTLVN